MFARGFLVDKSLDGSASSHAGATSTSSRSASPRQAATTDGVKNLKGEDKKKNVAARPSSSTKAHVPHAPPAANAPSAAKPSATTAASVAPSSTTATTHFPPMPPDLLALPSEEELETLLQEMWRQSQIHDASNEFHGNGTAEDCWCGGCLDREQFGSGGAGTTTASSDFNGIRDVDAAAADEATIDAYMRRIAGHTIYAIGEEGRPIQYFNRSDEQEGRSTGGGSARDAAHTTGNDGQHGNVDAAKFLFDRELDEHGLSEYDDAEEYTDVNDDEDKDDDDEDGDDFQWEDDEENDDGGTGSNRPLSFRHELELPPPQPFHLPSEAFAEAASSSASKSSSTIKPSPTIKPSTATPSPTTSSTSSKKLKRSGTPAGSSTAAISSSSLRNQDIKAASSFLANSFMQVLSSMMASSSNRRSGRKVKKNGHSRSMVRSSSSSGARASSTVVVAPDTSTSEIDAAVNAALNAAPDSTPIPWPPTTIKRTSTIVKPIAKHPMSSLAATYPNDPGATSSTTAVASNDTATTFTTQTYLDRPIAIPRRRKKIVTSRRASPTQLIEALAAHAERCGSGGKEEVVAVAESTKPAESKPAGARPADSKEERKPADTVPSKPAPVRPTAAAAAMTSLAMDPATAEFTIHALPTLAAMVFHVVTTSPHRTDTLNYQIARKSNEPGRVQVLHLDNHTPATAASAAGPSAAGFNFRTFDPTSKTLEAKREWYMRALYSGTASGAINAAVALNLHRMLPADVSQWPCNTRGARLMEYGYCVGAVTGVDTLQFAYRWKNTPRSRWTTRKQANNHHLVMYMEYTDGDVEYLDFTAAQFAIRDGIHLPSTAAMLINDKYACLEDGRLPCARYDKRGRCASMPGFAFVEHPWSRVADWCFGMIGRGLLQRVLFGRVGAATTCVVEGATTDASASASAGDSTSSTLTKPHATIHRDVLIPPPAPTDPPREPPHKDPSLVDDDPFSWGRIAGVYVTSAAWIDVMARTLGGGGNGGRGSDDHGDRRTREWHEMAT